MEKIGTQGLLKLYRVRKAYNLKIKMGSLDGLVSLLSNISF